MSKNFSKISNHVKTYATYSEFFNRKASIDEIYNDLRSINLEEALFILSGFTIWNMRSKQYLKEILIPLISTDDLDYLNSVEAFDVSNLMYTMKWFIAYGTRSPIQGFNNDFSNLVNVYLTVLKITDYMVDSINGYSDVQEVILKSSLFLRDSQLDRALIRQHVIFEEIARDRNRFTPKSFLDIHGAFEEKYGYTISQYISVVFTLNMDCIKGLDLDDIRNDTEWGINPSSFFDKVSIKNTALSIYKDIVIDPLNLREWAKNTLENPYDFEAMLLHPMFSYKNKAYPFSPGNMNSVLFEGLYFKIRNCYDQKDQSFHRFYGLLFESYVSNLLKDAVEKAKIKGYKFIEEFKYGKQNNLSSDAYILLGKSLLIIECKAGKIRKETKLEADEETSKGDFEKYVMKPITQASNAYTDVIKNQPNFFGKVKKVFILAVSSHSFPRLPRFIALMDDPEWEKNLDPIVKEYDFLGINEIELMAYIISNHDSSVFRFIETKKRADDFTPYQNYYYRKYGEIKKSDLLTEAFWKAQKNIRRILFSKNH
ncbi:hypothetical protein M3664_04420 [Paenibacillus lautus]|uniref:hypothetical protein n=1 Tax=Paenibacillus lautus TaxID=1401 RepID=UPI00203FE7AD|nr:hypothetical protein [Paenibacillus lautus]MCM3257025.1 hypothetical protein [Paenibacillus lautus]